MSLVKSALKSLAEKGIIEHEVTIEGVRFEFRALTSEEQLIADSMVNSNSLKKKYGAGDELNTFGDTISKYRNLALLCFAIKSIDGQVAVDGSIELEKQFKQRIEFRDELSELSPTFIDELFRRGYLEHNKKQREFFDNVKDNVGK
jgi:hypothetical protein